MSSFTPKISRRVFSLAALGSAAVVLSACSADDPLAKAKSKKEKTLVVGGPVYYSAEIIAEIYAQMLEKSGYQVDREFQIGTREVFLPEIIAGRIDVFPEYAGNLLQYFDKTPSAKTTPEIVSALEKVLPEGLRVLEPAPATDQDAYNVTKETAEKYGVYSIGDLTKIGGEIKIAGKAILAERPYGVSGLKEFYGVDAVVIPIEDSGGPLTVKALLDNDVTAANIYTASPAIKENNLVTLADPKSMIMPQNIIPLVSNKVDQEAGDILNKISAALSTEDVIDLNSRSQKEKLSSAKLATDWINQKGF